jgi:hypothetical protein
MLNKGFNDQIFTKNIQSTECLIFEEGVEMPLKVVLIKLDNRKNEKFVNVWRFCDLMIL